MTLLLDCLRLAIDLTSNEAEFRLQIKRDGENREKLAHDERTDLQAHTRARLARMREAG